MGHRKAASGINVGPEDCLRFGPVYQCLEIKSGDIGSAPLHCHKNEVKPGEDDVDYNQSAEAVCSLAWNELTPANEGWQNLVFHQQLWGNGFAYIARQGGSRNGPIQWMANLVPDRVIPTKVDGEMMYELKLGDGTSEFLNTWEVFHLRGLQITPMKAMQLFELMRDEIGLALGAKTWLSKFFERGGHHGGILEIPAGTKQKAVENLEKGVAKRADPSSWFKTMILRDGAKWQSATVDPRAAQMSELTEDEARAVCHFFNMPPWKIGLRNSESYNSAEQAALNYIRGCLLHVSTRIRGEANLKLLSQRTMRARTHRFEHDFTALLATDVKSLNEVLERQRRNEIITANEWRDRINMPRSKDPVADKLYNPNTKSDKRSGNGQSKTDGSSGQNDAQGTQNTGKSAAATQSAVVQPTSAFRPLNASETKLLADAGTRAAKRLFTVARNKARKPKDLLAWIDSAAAEHRDIVCEEVSTPICVVLPSCNVNSGLVGMAQMAAEGWFVSGLLNGIKPFLEAPHKASELEANVEAFGSEWVKSAGERWVQDAIVSLVNQE